MSHLFCTFFLTYKCCNAVYEFSLFWHRMPEVGQCLISADPAQFLSDHIFTYLQFFTSSVCGLDWSYRWDSHTLPLHFQVCMQYDLSMSSTFKSSIYMFHFCIFLIIEKRNHIDVKVMQPQFSHST